MSFNMFEEDSVKAETFMMGYTNNLYVSKNNIYITYQKNVPYVYYQQQNEEKFYNVVVPSLPSDIRREIESIRKDNSLNSYEKWEKVSDELEKFYNRLDENEKTEFIKDVENDMQEYEAKMAEERAKTVVHKISIDNGDIKYEANGEVKGNLLNQFSMDEQDGNLRLATTFEAWTFNKNIQHNNVYVLDSDLKQIGSLEKIAEDERIYSTRFIGDRLYMVTFKRMDPFFVIDLSNPKNPEVLGELKIPGFSDYLHPYDENHIIGIGKETDENEWGGISTKGVKLALFDVSNVNNPVQIDKYEIGKQGTDSEALQDHKAFLFDKKKNLLVIPIREVKGNKEYDPRLGYYRQNLWQGAYVFLLTEKGFELKGKISHMEGQETDYYYYGSPNAVRRSLYMDDVLYTVSMKKIKMNDLNNIDNEINSVKLPYEDYFDRPYPLPMMKGMSGGVGVIEVVPSSTSTAEAIAER